MKTNIVDTILVLSKGETLRVSEIPEGHHCYFRVGERYDDIGVLRWGQCLKFGKAIWLPTVTKLDGAGWILPDDTVVEIIHLHLSSEPPTKTIPPPEKFSSWADAICGPKE